MTFTITDLKWQRAFFERIEQTPRVVERRKQVVANIRAINAKTAQRRLDDARYHRRTQDIGTYQRAVYRSVADLMRAAL